MCAILNFGSIQNIKSRSIHKFFLKSKIKKNPSFHIIIKVIDRKILQILRFLTFSKIINYLTKNNYIVKKIRSQNMKNGKWKEKKRLIRRVLEASFLKSCELVVAWNLIKEIEFDTWRLICLIIAMTLKWKFSWSGDKNLIRAQSQKFGGIDVKEIFSLFFSVLAPVYM